VSELLVGVSPRSRRLLRLVGWAAVVLLILAALPFLVEILLRVADWFTSLFPHSSRLWEVSPWSY
jgi:hypothetical protein